MESLKRFLERLKNRQADSSLAVATIEPPMNARIQSLVDCLSSTQEQEADCAEFDAKMDCLAELLAQGRTRGEILSSDIEAHLRHSVDCTEEFNALIAILKAEQAGELD